MKRLILALGMAAAVLLSGNYSYAQRSDPEHKEMPHEGMAGMHHEGMVGMHHEGMAPDKGLSLTPEQEAKFKEIRRMFIRENAQIIGALVAKRLELRSLWTDPKSDPNAILDKERELGALQIQMRDKVAQAMVEARKILTPEQIENWKPEWRMRHRDIMEGSMHGNEMGGAMMEHGGMMHQGPMRGHGMMGSGEKMEGCCECPGM